MIPETLRIFSILFAAVALGMGVMLAYALFNMLVAEPHEPPKADEGERENERKRKMSGQRRTANV